MEIVAEEEQKTIIEVRTQESESGYHIVVRWTCVTTIWVRYRRCFTQVLWLGSDSGGIEDLLPAQEGIGLFINDIPDVLAVGCIRSDRTYVPGVI